jgi:uncharacterized protein YbjT (DUF2867 family)
MQAILFGATGMIGQAVLRELLIDPEVTAVLSVVRAPTASKDPKLTELVHPNFLDFSSVAEQLTGHDACLWCLGVSSAGMTEAEYKRITYDTTIAAASVMAKHNPGMTMLFVTGVGTDSTETKKSMWARVKGAAENALLAMPFKAAYMIRPAYIQPRHGVKSKSKWTRWSYSAFGWMYPLWKLVMPKYVTTSDELGRAMIQVAKHGAPKTILETRDLRALAPAALTA